VECIVFIPECIRRLGKATIYCLDYIHIVAQVQKSRALWYLKVLEVLSYGTKLFEHNNLTTGFSEVTNHGPALHVKYPE